MDKAHFVEILCANQKLIKHIFFVNALQDVLVNGVVKVCLHVLKNQIYVPMILANKHLMKLDDIRMLYFLEYGDFPESPLSIGSVLESLKYFFEGIGFFTGLMDYFPDVAIGTGAEFFENLIGLKNGGLDGLVRGHEI